MDLSEFRKDLLETVRARAESNLDFNRAGFVDEVGERLTDAEEFSDFIACRYEGISGKRKLQIDGYAFDDADNSLALLIADYSNDDVMPSFNTADATKSFGMLRSFVEEALKGNLTDGSIEESQPGHGFASDLCDWHPKVTRYRLYLASDGQLKSNAKDWPDADISGIQAEHHIWDVARFHRAYVSATGRDDLLVDFSDFGNGDGLPCLTAASAEGEYQAYLCMISGNVLAGIYERYGSRLLEGNVRSFLSTRGKVNAKIQLTIRHQPEMFFAFNNGIAATAENVVIEETPQGPKILRATNLQIVNGGQTTASLAQAARNSPSNSEGTDLSKVMVQMKLSVLPPEKASSLIPDIARYANSQNKVSDADFFANHAYHIRLEEFSRRIFAPPVGGAQHGSHWFYERARGQYINEQAKLSPAQKRQFAIQNPKSQLLSKTDVAKLINTWRGLPNKVSMGAQKNFLLFADLIAKAWNEDERQYNEEYFRDLIALAIIFRHTEILVKQQNWYQGGYRANIVTYTLAKLNCMITEQATGKQLDLRGVWAKQGVSIPLLEQIATIAARVFKLLTHPSRPKDNVTEWAKMQACWDQVKSEKIQLFSGIESVLVDSSFVKNAAKDARELQATDNGIATQVAVFNVPSAQWEQMRIWAIEKNLLTTTQSDLLRLASQIPRKIPTEKQCIIISQIHEKLVEAGFLFEGYS